MNALVPCTGNFVVNRAPKQQAVQPDTNPDKNDDEPVRESAEKKSQDESQQELKTQLTLQKIRLDSLLLRPDPEVINFNCFYAMMTDVAVRNSQKFTTRIVIENEEYPVPYYQSSNTLSSWMEEAKKFFKEKQRITFLVKHYEMVWYYSTLVGLCKELLTMENDKTTKFKTQTTFVLKHVLRYQCTTPGQAPTILTSRFFHVIYHLTYMTRTLNLMLMEGHSSNQDCSYIISILTTSIVLRCLHHCRQCLENEGVDLAFLPNEECSLIELIEQSMKTRNYPQTILTSKFVRHFLETCHRNKISKGRRNEKFIDHLRNNILPKNFFLIHHIEQETISFLRTNSSQDCMMFLLKTSMFIFTDLFETKTGEASASQIDSLQTRILPFFELMMMCTFNDSHVDIASVLDFAFKYLSTKSQKEKKEKYTEYLNTYQNSLKTVATAMQSTFGPNFKDWMNNHTDVAKWEHIWRSTKILVPELIGNLVEQI